MPDTLREAVEKLRDRMALWSEAVVPRGSVAHHLTAILDAHPDQEGRTYVPDAGDHEGHTVTVLAETDRWCYVECECGAFWRFTSDAAEDASREKYRWGDPTPSDQEVERCGGSGVVKGPTWDAGYDDYVPCPGCPDCQVERCPTCGSQSPKSCGYGRLHVHQRLDPESRFCPEPHCCPDPFHT